MTIQRHEDLDRAKGLTMILVVLGHVVARQPPAGNEWYIYIKHAIYGFHMAFFMFLSGLMFFMHFTYSPTLRNGIRQVSKNFNRLMPAYFLFAFLVVFGKWLAQSFAHVDNPVSGVNDILKIVLTPMQSTSSFLWYIYTLFLFYVVARLIFNLTKGRSDILVLIGLGLLFIPPIDFLGINQFCKYFLFFALGGFAWAHWDRYSQLISRFWIWFSFPFISLLLLGFGGVKLPNVAILGLLSIPVLHGICRLSMPSTINKLLLYVGTMVFPIYLMNTIAIGSAKAILLFILPWDGVNFILVYLPVLLFTGLFAPIAIKKYIFIYIPWLNKITS